MFTRSTAILRGCLHRNSSTPGRSPCRLGACIRCSSRSAPTSQEQNWYRPDPETTDSFVSAESDIEPTPSLAESRVQATRPPPARTSRWVRVQELRTVESHSDQIFGHKERTVSARLVARKRPGPEPISDLQPDRWGNPNSAKWSFPPAWKTLFPESESLPETTYEGFREFWRANYKELFEQTRKGNVAEVRTKLDAHRQVAASLIRDRKLEEVREAWANAPQRDKLHLASIMLGCLVDSARSTLLMLSLDINFPRDWRHRCECLCYLDIEYRDEIDADARLQELFAQQIKRISTIWTWPPTLGEMPWYSLVLLLRHNSLEHCENIIDTVLENYENMSPRLILVMVDHFTKLGDTDRAIELLSRIPNEQREEHKVRILQRCANLISIDTIEKSDSVGNFRALHALISLGLPMNAKSHNRILERALELGAPEVAWEVFRFMEAKDIQVDARSHLLLLKDSFERNNRENLDAMMSAIHGREDLYQYPYLVTYMMHIVRVVCTIDRNLAPEKSVSHLLAVYDKAYDRTPLIKLNIVNALPDGGNLRPKLEQPPPAVLGFTIWAYVLCQHDERLVSSLWFWIIHMTNQQDESILACAKHDIMWNGFIHFYARGRFYLRKAVDVVEAMIEHNLCMPTERTWSEVLCGFMRHGEEETAAKIWSMMMARDIQPTKKGWAFLLEKYDQTQLSELVKYVLDERQMPEGLDTTLGWKSREVVKDETPAETTDAPHMASMQVEWEDFTRDELLEGEDVENSEAYPAPDGAQMCQ